MEDKITWNYDDKILNRYSYIDFKDKNSVVRLLINNMLIKTNSMFEWEGLPDTIPQEDLEIGIQTHGHMDIIEKDGQYFAVRGYTGGIYNYNYRPKYVIISNPYLLKKSMTYEIFYGDDSELKDPPPTTQMVNDGKCVVINNDPFYMGLLPLCNLYASQYTDNLLTKRIATINMRAMYIGLAGDTDTRDDFNDFFDKLEKGDIKAVLAEGILGGHHDNLTMLPFADRGHEVLTDLIEDQQYIKASWLNELGLQANYNMKRESINSNESQLNKDAVLPLVDKMLACRKKACKRVKELFGLDWSVDFSSAWKYTRQTIEQAIDSIDDTSDMKQTEEQEVDHSDGQVEENEVKENE